MTEVADDVVAFVEKRLGGPLTSLQARVLEDPVGPVHGRLRGGSEACSREAEHQGQQGPPPVPGAARASPGGRACDLG